MQQRLWVCASMQRRRRFAANTGREPQGIANGQEESERNHVCLAQYGHNEVEHEKPLSWWWHLWHCYENPFNLLLTLLADLPPGTATDAEAASRAIIWRRPRWAARLQPEPVGHLLDEAHALGVVGRGAISTPARLIPAAAAAPISPSVRARAKTALRKSAASILGQGVLVAAWKRRSHKGLPQGS